MSRWPSGYTRRGVPLAERFWSKVDKSGECWLWTGAKNSEGYGYIQINRRAERATRIVWLLAHGVIPGALVLHHCDNPPCVNPAHLFEGTDADNAHDRARKGRSGRANAKLTALDVAEIRATYTGRYGGLIALARRYGVNPSTVVNVLRGRTWTRVP